MLTLAVVLLMLATPLAAVLPVGGVITDRVDDATLPIEWTLEGGDSASFDVTMPVGEVTKATLDLEGTGTEVLNAFEHDGEDWADGSIVDSSGVDLTGGNIEASTEHLNVWEGPGDLGSTEPSSGVTVGQTVTLAVTSPTFTGANGGIWKHYIPVEISLETGKWERDTLTFINLDIPPGHCRDIDEIRIADPNMREVPLQVIDVERSVATGMVLYVELLFATDMPPEGSRIYRVYYGNPNAEDPNYTPMLLGAELWNYDGPLDPAFTAVWKNMRWSGGAGAGMGWTGFSNIGGNSKQITQAISVSPGRTFSQVYTSTHLKNDDFQLTTWVRGFGLEGPDRSTGTWGLDFRVSGDDCYRLMYTEALNTAANPKLTLYRISNDRHFSSFNTTGSWVVLDELGVSPIGNEFIPIRIRCLGENIDIWVGGGNTPALRARNSDLDTGEVGTFIGGRGVLLTSTSTTVSYSIGPVLILPPNVNMTDRSHSFFPHEERQQHFLSGSWISDTYQLEGARDAIINIDVSGPFETSYTAYLLNGAGDKTIVSDIRDGDQVPEGALDDGFKLMVELETKDDGVTPELRSWGIGYRAVLNPTTDRGAFEKEDVTVQGDSLVLMPSRDVWLKEDLPMIKPGNIDEDAAGVTISSVVGYGNSFRVYYTGLSDTGVLTICVAISTDGESFSEFLPIFGGDSVSLAWDAVRRDPVVVFLDDVWLMYYIGERITSQVGLAISGNGIDWTPYGQPVLSPTTGSFDSKAILDCHVILHNNLFMMYYTGLDSSSDTTAIGYAFSGDGGTWTKSPNNPMLKPSATSTVWDSGYVRSPYVVPTRDQYVMYYLGGKGSNHNGGLSSIGYATSTTGTDFAKAKSNPVIEPRVGGLADDYRGIRSLWVLEDLDDRYTILYTGQGMDWANRVFEARSGFKPSGHYISKPYNLDRRPDSFTGVKVDVDVPRATSVELSMRTSADGNSWTDWYPLWPDGAPQDVHTAELFQLRLNLTTEFGEDSPRVRNVVVDYVSCVRFSTITVFPVPIVPETIVAIYPQLHGTGTDDVKTDIFLEGTGWSDLAVYGGHGRYGTGPDFGYRFNFSSPPAKVHSITNASFALGYISFPSDVTIDVGNDGTDDITFQPQEFEGLHELTVTEPTKTWMDTNGDDMDELTITFRISSATPGILTLHGASFTVDTMPRIVDKAPDTLDVHLEEGDSQLFSLTVDELDGDEISYTWYIDDEEVADTPTFTYSTEADEDTDDPAPVSIGVSVFDGTYPSPMVQWTVYVADTTPVPNELPFIDVSSPDTPSVTMDENTTKEFFVYVTDPDVGPDALTYTWYVDDVQVSTDPTEDSYEFVADYESAGTYTIRMEATDGEATINHTWELTVDNVKKPGPNGNGNGGNGDGTDDPGVNWLPILFILVILGVAGVGGVMYMRGQKAKMGGEGVPSEASEPVTADVPLEPELAQVAAEPAPTEPSTSAVEGPSITEKASLGKDVGAGPSAPDAAKATAIPAGLLPLADMDKDRSFVVEEIYVVYNDGRLMCHQARAERTSVDTDLFGGMFTAIQQFIHDSMGGEAGKGTQVGRLDYGENRILVERGNYVFLAVIIFGEEQETLREAMRDAINRIEGSYAGVIEKWSGDQTQLSGVGAFVAPLIGLTQDLNREAIMAKTRIEGVKMLSEVEFFQGFVRLKVAVRNDTKMVITNVATDIVYDSNVLRVDRIQPEYPMSGTKVTMGTIAPREKKTVAYYLDPLICQESDIDGTSSFKDAEGNFGTVTMKRRRADIVCPIFFTEENANTAMLKRLIHEELKESDSKLFTIPKMLSAPDAFALGKEVIRGHDVRFVREFVEDEEGQPYRAEAWYYGVTKVKKDKMVIRTSIWEDRKTIEFFVAAGRIESITGLLAELGQNLNKSLKDKYLGRVSATLVVDPEQQEEVKGLGLLIDKYSEHEMDAGEVDQRS
jgi:predicted GH43/DUF377 family glycosyl hydrolase